MQLASGSHIPDGLLAVMTLLNEKPRHGVASKNVASNPGIDERNSTVAIGLRAALHLEAVRESERARYYSSNDARFLTPDPLPWIAWQNGSRAQQQAFEAHLANPQDLNMYVYVLDNPLSKTDPTGMNACGTSNKDSSCTVTVTLQDRKKVNGHYSDQFSNLKGNGDYNATATVTVSDHGKVIGKGTFLASTVPSGKGFATIKNGTYSGTLGSHDHHAAILLNGGGPVPVVGGVDPATGKSFATGIYVHIAGWME
ncbi:MAG: hypothetical protein ACP5M4_16010, partial [Acidobacteriaceae bacterium]